MRIWSGTLVALLVIGVDACTHDDQYRDSASREAGKLAYGVAQDARQAARKAGREVREASREVREGWNEAKHEAQAKSKKQPDRPHAKKRSS